MSEFQTHEIKNTGPSDIEVEFGPYRITINPGQQFEGGLSRITLPKEGRVSFSVAPFNPPPQPTRGDNG